MKQTLFVLVVAYGATAHAALQLLHGVSQAQQRSSQTHGMLSQRDATDLLHRRVSGIGAHHGRQGGQGGAVPGRLSGKSPRLNPLHHLQSILRIYCVYKGRANGLGPRAVPTSRERQVRADSRAGPVDVQRGRCTEASGNVRLSRDPGRVPAAHQGRACVVVEATI